MNFYDSISPYRDGLHLVSESFERLYYGTLDELRGLFTEGEKGLMLDVMNGTMISASTPGAHLPANVADGIALDALDEKWAVDAEGLRLKLGGLPRAQLHMLEIWCSRHWTAVGEGRDADAEAIVAEVSES